MQSFTSQPIRGSTFTPGPDYSPGPRKKAKSGECSAPEKSEPSSEVVAERGLTTSGKSDDPKKIHHGEPAIGDIADPANPPTDPPADDDVTTDDATTCDDSRDQSETADDPPAPTEPVNQLVNVQPSAMVASEDETEQEKVARMEQEMFDAYASMGVLYLTPDEQQEQAEQDTKERFLMCLEMGLSMRQAAKMVGRHHTTFVKRAQRDEHFAAAIRRSRQRARTGPLQSIYEASQKSWRAAAWLLNYMDRKENQGGNTKQK